MSRPNQMRRLAYASPVNPAPSGISDYSEELLPYLGQYAEITLYVDDGLRPSNPQLARHLDVRPLSKLVRDQRRRPFDALLYHLGNSPAHAAIWRAMQRAPGVAVMHEIVLHHFMLQYYANVVGDIERYRAEAARRYGAEGERIANLMLHGRFTEAAFALPFCEDVLAVAEGVIGHSQHVCARAAAMRPGLPVAHVPMGIPLPPQIERATARARRGLPQEAPILASFGHINPYKRIDATLRAVRALQPSFPDIRYILVGSVSPSYDLHAAVARAGMQGVVQVTGYVDRSAFEEYVAAADLCVNLRHPTAGETSASLLRLLGAGRATLVTASGSFTELPPGTAAQVDPDRSEGDLIQAYCRLLLGNPALADQLGAAARAYVASQHTMQGAAAGTMRFLSQRYGWGDPQPLRPPLWDPASPERAHAPAPHPAPPGERSGQPAETQFAVGADPRVRPPEDPRVRPNLAQTESTIDPLVRRTGQVLAEIGAGEQDAALLRGAAQALHDLTRREE